MFIKNVTIENVKSFTGTETFDFCAGVNFFVGDNNSGKSTILEALLFLFEGPSANKYTPESFYAKEDTGATRVSADIQGALDALVSHSTFKVLDKYVFDVDGVPTLRLDRSSQDRAVTQNGKSKTLTVKGVGFWNDATQSFENPTGIDAKVKALFDFEAVWADSHPTDHIDFANTKTLGRLLGSVFSDFKETSAWQELESAHSKAFASSEEKSFVGATEHLTAELSRIVSEQYGEAEFRLAFEIPDATTFLKQGTLNARDASGAETPASGKGTGMQRAIALGLIQMYARTKSSSKDGSATPLALLLDEPETWLHPSAQLTLGEALNKIGEEEQVFVITHSPYLLRKFDAKRNQLTVLAGSGAGRKITKSAAMGVVGQGVPSWGEINYAAFQVCSVEFHNELYGEIQRRIELAKGEGKTAAEKEIDEYLLQKGVPKDKIWRRPNLEYPSTLTTYIRNSIHHPENALNDPYTEEELLMSIQGMLAILK